MAGGARNHTKITDYLALKQFLDQSLSRLPAAEIGTLIQIGLREKLRTAKNAYDRGNKDVFRLAFSEIKAVVGELERLFGFRDSASRKAWEDEYLRMVSPEEYAKSIEALRNHLRASLRKKFEEEKRRGLQSGARKTATVEKVLFDGKEKLLDIDTLFSEDAETVFYIVCHQAQKALLGIFNMKSIKEWPPIALEEKLSAQGISRAFIKLIDVLFTGIAHLSYTDSIRKLFASEEAKTEWYQKNAALIYRAVTAVLTAWAFTADSLSS